jgi:hypothetical protein
MGAYRARLSAERRERGEIAIRRVERVRMHNARRCALVGLQGEAKNEEPGGKDESRQTPRHGCCACSKPGRSFAAVAASSSGMTFASARTGMKLVSPFQRGTTWRWM